MNDLNEKLKPIIEKMKNFRPLYEQNEDMVRKQIIDPILSLLGWDTEHPAMVRHNVPGDAGIPDYSLLKNGKVILFIEAKNLSVDIDQHIKQLAKYSFDEGTKYGVLTNGAVWKLIISFREGSALHERGIWKIDLESDDIVTASKKLLTISEANIENIEILIKRLQILDEIWQSLLDEPETLIKGLVPVLQSLIYQSYPTYQFEDIEVEDFLETRINEVIPITLEEEVISEIPLKLVPSERKLQWLKLNGESFKLNDDFEILVNVANWLIKKGKLKPSNCPIQVKGGKRYLINHEKVHSDGKKFTSPKQLSNRLWVETNADTPRKIDCARLLLEKFGYSPDILVLEY